jgi:hypothetical protein
VIEKINDKTYTIKNIQNQNDDSITLEIDKTKITKKLSGSSGFIVESKLIGNSTKYPVTITGELNPIINKAYTYTANDNMKKYDWIILNGEIISSAANTVTVKWNTPNAQSITLRYQTPLNCTLTATKEVSVIENPLGVEDYQVSVEKSFITPVPNKGQFTIQTNIILSDCTLDIFDATGKLVHQEKKVNLNSKAIGVDVNLPSGVYILILYNKEEKLQFKFFIN